MSFQKGNQFYDGKAKTLFAVNGQPDFVWVHFKDSLTAFNAEKKGSFTKKGELNRDITTLIFKYLQQHGVATHMVENQGPNEMICRRVEIAPLEVVVRNVMAGSTAKKFHMEEGTKIEKPLVEFYYKKDEWGDPFISDDQALMLKAVASQNDLNELKRKGLQINELLKKLFAECGIDLVDFKIEFGRDKHGQWLLADEITPDSCRLWDQKSKEKLDKDRFRRDLGKVEESYQEVYKRLKERWGSQL